MSAFAVVDEELDYYSMSPEELVLHIAETGPDGRLVWPKEFGFEPKKFPGPTPLIGFMIALQAYSDKRNGIVRVDNRRLNLAAKRYQPRRQKYLQ